MERRPLLPEYRDSPYEGYAIKWLERNYWRFAKTVGSWEDAVSEAALVYYSCRQRYGDRVENRAHFMALFKRCILSRFTDLANTETKTLAKEKHCKKAPKVTTGFEGNLLVKLREASSELKDVLKIIFDAPGELAEVLQTDIADGLSFLRNAIAKCGHKEKSEVIESELKELLIERRSMKRKQPIRIETKTCSLKVPLKG